MKTRVFALLFAVIAFGLWLGLVMASSFHIGAESGPTPAPSQPVLEDLASGTDLVGPEFRFVELIGQIDGPPRCVAVEGKYAYLDIGPRLAILDISNPAKPVEVGFYPLMAGAADLVVSGTYVFIAESANWTGEEVVKGGLRIVDVADPAQPVLVASYQTAGMARGLAISGTYAYLTDGQTPWNWDSDVGKGLHVIDISDLANPKEVSFYDGSSPYAGVAVSGNYAYVAATFGGLRVFDVSNPSDLVEVGSFQAWSVGSLVISGNLAYLGETDHGLRILDITNPHNLVDVGSYMIRDVKVMDVSLSGQQVYLAAWDKGLRVIDVSDPAWPKEVAVYDALSEASGVAAAGGYAFLVDYEEGLIVFDLAVPPAPTRVGTYGKVWYASSVAVSNTFAYLSVQNSGLLIVDVSAQSRPKEVGFVPVGRFGWDVVVSDHYAYLGAYETGLSIIDVADPSNPTTVGHYSIPTATLQMAISGTYLYVVDSSSPWGSSASQHGLRIIDVADPYSPTLVGFCPLPASTNAIALSGNYAYVAADGAGLRVIDVSNPLNPVEVGADVATGWAASSVAISGTYAYVTDDRYGLRVIDVGQPSKPTEVGSLDLLHMYGVPSSVAISGTLAYVAEGSQGLRVVDISNPASPVEVGYHLGPRSALDVTVSGDTAYVADNGGGLWIVRYIGGSFNHRAYLPAIWR